jgi:hypothetical protein
MEENTGHNGEFDFDAINLIGDAVEPDVGDIVDKIDLREVRSNLSAMLYLMTEQQAVISELLSTLLEAGILSHEGLVRVSSARKNKELTEAVYTDLHKDFVQYFLKTKWLLMTDAERESTAEELRRAGLTAENMSDDDQPIKEA